MFPYVLLRYTVGAALINWFMIVLVVVVAILIYVFYKSIIALYNRNKVNFRDITSEQKVRIEDTVAKRIATWNGDLFKIKFDTLVIGKRCANSIYCSLDYEPMGAYMLDCGMSKFEVETMKDMYKQNKSNIVALRRCLNECLEKFDNGTWSPRNELRTTGHLNRSLYYQEFKARDREILIRMSYICPQIKALNLFKYYTPLITKDQFEFANLVLQVANLWDVRPTSDIEIKKSQKLTKSTTEESEKKAWEKYKATIK